MPENLLIRNNSTWNLIIPLLVPGDDTNEMIGIFEMDPKFNGLILFPNKTDSPTHTHLRCNQDKKGWC